MRLLGGYFRSDHIRIGGTRLVMEAISADLGWCEVPDERTQPTGRSKCLYAASHETMRRADPLYDYCIVLDWNIVPRRRRRGSAIFFYSGTTRFFADARLRRGQARVMARRCCRICRGARCWR